MSKLEGYNEAKTGAVYFQQTTAGFLKIAGPDRMAFLQRQTSNDIRLLSEQKSLLTALTNPNARILDIFRLVLDPGETIGAISLAGRAAVTWRYLKSRIFFMDKVSIDDASAIIVQVELHGPKAGELLQRLGLPGIPQADEVIQGTLGGIQTRAIGQDGFSGKGFLLLAAAENTDKLLATLEDNQAPRLPVETYQVLRVEAGIPAVDHELTEAYTPLESGLEDAISTNKGCYTGQEVIARQITYDKVTQHLVGLRLEAPAAPGERVWVDGKPVGSVTSTAISPDFGPIALGIIKRPYHQAGTRVIISTDGKGEGSPAITSKLPFQPAT